MRICEYYSHMNGYEWIMYRRPKLWSELRDTIESIGTRPIRVKQSQEKTRQGQTLLSPTHINRSFKKSLESKGWESRRASFWVTSDYATVQRIMSLTPAEQKAEILAAGMQPIRSYHQTDFVKQRVAVEVQLGKYSFIAYDLAVKHLAFFSSNIIDLGIEILPMKSMLRQMSSGPPYFERAAYDLARQGRGVPAVPLILIGLDV